MSLVIKDGRIRTYNADGDETFDTAESMAFFVAQATGSFTLPAQTNANNTAYEVKEIYFDIADELPDAVTWVQGMIRADADYFTTDWLCFGGSTMIDYYLTGSGTTKRVAVLSPVLDIPNFQILAEIWIDDGSVPETVIDYVFVFGGFR